MVEESEFSALCDASDNPMVVALLGVAYRQGLRRQELVNLRWASVDLDRRVLHIVNVPEAGELTKSRKNRSLPMHPAVHSILGQLWAETPKRVEGGSIATASPHVFCWPDGKQWKPDWVSREFAKLVTKSGIGPCTLHDLRRSFSTLAQRAGVDKYTVKDLGGWSVVSVVEKYYTGEVNEVYRRAMEKIVKRA